MKRAIVIGLVATVLVVAGCGGEPRASITPSASHQLAAVVAQVRTAASSGDVAAATARLTDIRRRVISLRRQGDLSEDAATRILLAAGAVETDLRLAPTTTTTPPTTTTTEPPTETTEKRRGKGHGGDGGGGD